MCPRSTATTICRDLKTARDRFGVTTGELGVITTRTGRRFFKEAKLESELLERLRGALDRSGFWTEQKTSWEVLDCELMPWSMKAQDLVLSQYASVGAASRAALADVLPAVEKASARGVDLGELLSRTQERSRLVHRYVEAYRRYCWPVDSIDDLKLAPFHLLASEGAVHADKPHTWHLDVIGKICAADPKILLATAHRFASLEDPASVAEAIAWWEDLTARGGEGMVVKPIDFIARGRRGLVQPAVKCRGAEYLRIIYGPEYSMPSNLERLRSRGLGMKRSLALREFALGIEGLERFVKREPLRRVHECVFGVLALESEPVDPRL